MPPGFAGGGCHIDGEYGRSCGRRKAILLERRYRSEQPVHIRPNFWEAGMNESNPKLKAWGIALGLVMFAIVSLDFVILKGDPVASGRLSLRADSEPLELSITQPFKEHLVEISTRRTKSGETVGQSISYRLIDPDGVTVAEDSELVSHKKRFFDFVPRKAGDYRLYAEVATLIGSGRGTGYVNVTVGDRRILSRLMRF
jgi:hypothetical protein